MLSMMLSAALANPLVGAWATDEGLIEISGDASGHKVRMTLRGDVLQEGTLREEDGVTKAAMEGCGATLKLAGDQLNVDLDGPECPVELIGTYALKGDATATHCEPGAMPAFHCIVKGNKRLEVCKIGDALTYRFGKLGAVELALESGTKAERNLASGSEFTFDFTNDGHKYSVWVVESARAQDNGAGVIITKADKEVARLACLDGWSHRAQ